MSLYFIVNSHCWSIILSGTVIGEESISKALVIFNLYLFILFIMFEVGFSNRDDLLEAIYTEPIILGKHPALASKGLGL